MSDSPVTVLEVVRYAGPMTRAILLWQISDLLRQARRTRVWWATQDPIGFGGYWE